MKAIQATQCGTRKGISTGFTRNTKVIESTGENHMSKETIKALTEVAISLGSLIAGVTFIGLGTNLYIALGVFFLVLYYNSTQES
jgi:hypothetical protein